MEQIPKIKTVIPYNYFPKPSNGRLIFEKGIHPLGVITMTAYREKPINYIPLPEILEATQGNGPFLDFVMGINALKGVETIYFNAPKFNTIGTDNEGNKIANITDGNIKITFNTEYSDAINLIRALITAYQTDEYPYIDRDEWLVPGEFMESKLNDEEKVNVLFSFDAAAKYVEPKNIIHPNTIYSPPFMKVLMEKYFRTLQTLVNTVENIFWKDKFTVLLEKPLKKL